MKILRCWCSTPSGDKLFAINLPSTTKQYKVDNIVNFVYYGKTGLNILDIILIFLKKRAWDVICSPLFFFSFCKRLRFDVTNRQNYFWIVMKFPGFHYKQIWQK